MIAHTIQTPKMDVEFSMEFIFPYEMVQNISYYMVMSKEGILTDKELYEQERLIQHHIRRQTELFTQREKYGQSYSRIRLGNSR
jgi:hypothetical protein